MNWKEIWSLLLRIFGEVKDASDWKVSKDAKPIGPVTGVTINVTDVGFVLQDDGTSLTLEARPDSLDHASVYVNGVLQPAASVVVALRSQPPFKPIILVLIFKHISLGSEIHDYRFDNPK